MEIQYNKNRRLIMINFVIVFGWIMSFPYEGPVMYAMIHEKGLDGTFLNMVTVFFVFLGLFTGRFISKDIVSAKKVITVCTGMALVISLFVPFSNHWGRVTVIEKGTICGWSLLLVRYL